MLRPPLFIIHVSHIITLYALNLVVCCLAAKSCSLFCNPMDCNLPGSSAHEIFQARTLEWENKMAEEEVDMKTYLSPRIYQDYTFRHRSAC